MTGVIDYSVGDLVRAMKKFRGDSEVVRYYEKVRELLVLRLIENKDLDASTRNKLCEEWLVDSRVGELSGVDVAKELSDVELVRRMGELGWVRKGVEVNASVQKIKRRSAK